MSRKNQSLVMYYLCKVSDMTPIPGADFTALTLKQATQANKALEAAGLRYYPAYYHPDFCKIMMDKQP